MPPDDYRQFLKRVDALKQQCCLKLFNENRQSIQIKKEKTIAKNMERIFAAALKISNEKSFHAMSMRDISREADMSIGALYNYFTGKEELLRLMQQQRRTITREILSADIAAGKDPLEKLRTAIRTHLYLSEVMQPWFYFSYMEAKNLDPDERRAAVESELNTERQFADILEYFDALDEVPEVERESDLANVMRPDEVHEGLSQEEALANAAETEDGFFKGPRVS